MHLVRVTSHPVQEKFGNEEVSLASENDAELINSFRKDFATLRQSGIVVYVFVPTTSGMATLRFESSQSGKFSERVVKSTSMKEEEFEANVAAASQPLAAGIREQLRNSLLPSNLSDDAGKIVLYKDLNFYGVLPQTFELTDGLLFASGDIKKAVRRAGQLATVSLNPRDITAFVGYPETAEHLKAVFGDGPTASLDEWSGAMKDMRQLSKIYGFQLYGLTEMDRLGSKKAVLEKLMQSKEIVWIIAHGNGCFIRLTSGELIEITPQDIEQLKLLNSPLVIVRVCDAAESGFPKAFLKAGAKAVYVNRGKVSALDVNAELSALLRNSKNATFTNAIKQTNANGSKTARSGAVYVDLKPLITHGPYVQGENTRYGSAEQ